RAHRRTAGGLAECRGALSIGPQGGPHEGTATEIAAQQEQNVPAGHGRDEVSRESLEQEATFILEESRMVLPGIQALFGFQLIAVFNQGFGEKLAPSEQVLHLLAFALVAVATALIITPAAY